MIDLYHADLQEAHIGLLVRDKAPNSNGRITLGAAKRTPADMRAYLPFDFIIWFAGDEWTNLNQQQRRALVDHELYHCQIAADGAPKMREHDIEEFNAIIERYGWWRPFSEGTALAVQSRFAFAQGGGLVVAADPAILFPNRDVLNQVEDLLGDDGEKAA